MTQDHRVFDDPQDINVIIWRYMDFTKLIWLLENKALFFPRSDKLGDPFEGSITQKNIEFNPTSSEEQLQQKLKDFRIFIRQWTYVSCWHMNEYESAAMWKTYTQSNEAISIQSTYKTLKDLLPDNAYIGIVNYIDYEKDFIPETNTFYPFVHKRKSFEHENEIRAVIQDVPLGKNGGIDYSRSNSNNGVSIDIEPDKLIKKVYIAPASPSWYKELINSMIKKYKLNCPVIQSSMDEDPVF